MTSKKQSKKESPVLLGFPDGPIEQDNDAYVTKLGGLPVRFYTFFERKKLIVLFGIDLA